MKCGRLEAFWDFAELPMLRGIVCDGRIIRIERIDELPAPTSLPDDDAPPPIYPTPFRPDAALAFGGIGDAIPKCPHCGQYMRLVRWDTVPMEWACKTNCTPTGKVKCPATHGKTECNLCKGTGYVEEL